MSSKRIIDLQTASSPANGMYLAVDHETNGTKKIAASQFITTVDSTLNGSSTNPVQNKVINSALSGKLATNGNSQNNTTSFTSGDVADSSVTRTTGWTTVSALATGATHSTLFQRISQMMKNVRWLYKVLGTTDISGMSSAGTVTGALDAVATAITSKLEIYKGTSFDTAFENATADKYTLLDITNNNNTGAAPGEQTRWYGIQFVNGTRLYGFQIAFSFGEDTVFVRRRTNSSTPTSWSKMPTRSEIAELTGKSLTSITRVSWGTSISFTMPAGSQGMLIINHTGEVLLFNSTSALDKTAVAGSLDALTFTRGSDGKTITVTRTANAAMTAIVF